MSAAGEEEGGEGGEDVGVEVRGDGGEDEDEADGCYGWPGGMVGGGGEMGEEGGEGGGEVVDEGVYSVRVVERVGADHVYCSRGEIAAVYFEERVGGEERVEHVSHSAADF